MLRSIPALTLAIALAACNQSTEAGKAPETTAAAAGNPCALIADPAAVFGRPVTATHAPMPNMCQWQSADAAVTGSIIVHGQGWSPVSDAAQAYADMLGTLDQFGQTHALADLGEEARATAQAGASPVQIVFRKGAVAANVGASSSDPALTSAALAERIARTAADNL
jgi:hypothetical protein